MSLSSPTPRSVLVTDFDGTMTRTDFYLLARARWWDDTKPDPWLDYIAGRITHFDALNLFFACIRADETTLREFVNGMGLDPAIPSAFERLHQAGWALVIASAGCDWYIRHLLRDISTPYVLHANPGRLTAEGSLRMIPPADSPFFTPRTGIDKVAVVRDALRQFDRVAFAGDGPPDVDPARLVPGSLRFARGHLAETLGRDGEGFLPLVDWACLADTLLQLRSP